MITPHGLAAAGRRMNISTMSLNLTERSSTANMSLSDLSGIQIADMVTSWFLDDEQPGKNIVWRARNISRAYHSDTSSIQLEHIINVLRDTIIFGEVKTEDISAWAGKDKKAKKVSARDAVRYALHFQNDWVLGTFDYDDEVNPYAFDGETVYDALEYVSASLEDAFWSYDMTTYPFTLNITNNNASKLPKNSQSIMRAGRNLNTITRNIDKSGMYTRFYATGKDDLKMEFGKDKTPYRDRNTTKYGIIEHAEQDNSLTTQEQLQFWALTKLRKHDAPVVTIDVDGLELADATGESVDRFTLGRLCRVPLPEFSTTIEEKIVGLSYSDKKNQPESVKVSLSNKREDVTKIIAQQTQAARRSSRVQQRQNKSTMEIVRNTIKEVQIAGPDKNNQYKLQYKLVTHTDWKDAPVNFSRAVTSWNVKKVADGQIRVTAKPQEQYKDVYVRAGTITRQKVKDKWTNIYKGTIQYSENKSVWATTDAEISVNATDSYNDGRTFGIDEGRKQVYVKSVALESGYSYLDDFTERRVVRIQGKSGIKGSTSYDKTLTTRYALSPTKYSGNQIYCVNLMQYNATTKDYTDIVGRADIQDVYLQGRADGEAAGEDSVTVKKVALADGWSFLGDTRSDWRYQIPIQGTASNGKKKSDVFFNLRTYTYVNKSRYCVDLMQLNSATGAYTDIIGRIDIHHIYETGKTDGKPIGWREANDALQMPAAGTNDYTDFVVPSSNYNQTASYRYTVSCDSNYVYLKNAANTVVARKAHTLYADGWRAANDALVMPQAATNEYMDVVVPSSNVDQTASYRYTISSDSSYLYIKNAAKTVVARKAHTLYSDGWKAANDALQMPRASTESFMDVIVPSSNVHQQAAYRYITDFDDNYVYIKIYGVNTVVARKSHTLYRDGWRAANDVVEPPSASTKAYMDIVVPAYNVGSTSSYRYNLDFDNNYVYIKINGVNTVVARKSHTLYRDGWRAANDAVVMPEGQTANAYMDVVIPSSNVNQTASYRYTVSASGGKTYIKNAAGTVVAQGTYPTPDYDVDFIGTGTFQSSVSPQSALSGWSPEQITGVGDSQQNMYRFIKFKVDGKQRSFYFA